ncbi:MAG: aldo/keto reductase [Gammaproteobacteria bacterium]|jgi:aryl-alcohol dehydrogenase-like predicted oxidoreductase|nr:aldo/keto reductase [Gammaproteobacteria bacterium]MBT4377460.1 aldo/keto reductase [Gammaproteobacteria bacterium]MBT5196932.1 aldo/keto reductase [Gammaproteobacteria bacterium]MBT5445179.1 aldo/keto reductase [Gammaproteobacteria bacterium]MBT6667192.1 aldo/keto reductase [Gammaproteobacteria bacterium]
MQQNSLGTLFDVSALTLGGGGIGQVWGETTQEEAVATVHEAYNGGVTFFDMAPMYGDGEAERVLGLAFADGYPDGVRVTTKCMIGPVAPDDIEARLTESLRVSCERLRREHIDVFILHGFIIPDGWQAATRPAVVPHIAIERSIYTNVVVPVFESWIVSGRISAFGVTAASITESNLGVLADETAPSVVQCIANVLDSPGNMAISDETPDPRSVISSAHDAGIGVMGIRAVAAGALATAIDREVKPHSAEARDFQRAAAFRTFAADSSVSPAALAHRYALSMPGVDTVVLGVKNREELNECLQAEAASRFSPTEMNDIDALVRQGE